MPMFVFQIDLEKNSAVISTFQNGVQHGFSRQWNEAGNLSYVGHVWNGDATGTCWQLIGSTKVVHDCQLLKRGNGQEGLLKVNMQGTWGAYYHIAKNIALIILAKW